MKMIRTILPLAALTTTLAQAQVMTEVRISTAGLDEEYVEIRGIPSQSADGLMLVSVEGDPSGSGGGEGTLQDVYDLSAGTFPAGDEYYVVGSTATATAFPGEVDESSFGDNMWENSSQTIYLLLVPDPMKRTELGNTLFNTDIRNPAGSTTTILSTDPDITILDAVAIWDGDMGDVFFDNAPVFGPDGNFMPSGVFRPGGCPSDWCSDTFLNFQTNGMPNPPYADPTPGQVNPTSMCTTLASVGNCNAGTSVGTPYCMVETNSSGGAATIEGNGSPVAANNDLTLSAGSMPANQFGFFLNSRVQAFVPMAGGSNGNLCLGGSIGRFDDPSEILNAGATGEFSLMIDLTNIPRSNSFEAAMSGETWYFQAWFRDIAAGGGGSNFTPGLEVGFL